MKTRLLGTLMASLLLPIAAFGAEEALLDLNAEQPQPLTEVEAPIAAAGPWGDESRDLWGGRAGYLHPFIAIEERYTDNLFHAASDPESEWTTLITPGLWLIAPKSRQPQPRVNTMLAVPGGLAFGRFRNTGLERFQVYTLYRANIEEHARFHDEDRVNQRGEGFFRYRAPGGLSLELFDVYEQKQDPYSTDNGTTRRLDIVDSNLVQVLGSLPLGARLRLGAGYANYLVDFDSTRNRFRTREDNLLSSTLAYRASPKTDLLLLYERIDIDYDEEVLQDSTEQHVYAGTEWQMTAKSRGRIMLGYGWKDFRAPASDDRQELIGEGRLEHRFTPKTSTYLQATRKTTEPDSPVGGGVLAHQLQIGGRQRLLAKVSASADVFYLREEYREAMTIDGQTALREDDYYGAGGSLGYAPARGLGLTLGYRYLERDSNFDSLRYRSNTVYLSLSAAL